MKEPKVPSRAEAKSHGVKHNTKNKAGDSVHLGSFGVDSGTIMIIDPCYLKSLDQHHGTGAEIHKEMTASLDSRPHGAGDMGLGFVTGTLWGDGHYDVYGMFNDEGRIDHIVIPLDIYPGLADAIKKRKGESA